MCLKIYDGESEKICKILELAAATATRQPSIRLQPQASVDVEEQAPVRQWPDHHHARQTHARTWPRVRVLYTVGVWYAATVVGVLSVHLGTAESSGVQCVHRKAGTEDRFCASEPRETLPMVVKDNTILVSTSR
jgi:hypothetical protein